MTVPAVLLSKYYDPSIPVEIRKIDGSLHNEASDSEAIYRLIAARAIEGNVAPRSGRLRYLRMTVPVEQAVEIIVADSVCFLSGLARGERPGSMMSMASQEIVTQWEIGPMVFAHKLNVMDGVA